MSRGGWIEVHSGSLKLMSRAVRGGLLGPDLRFLALRSAGYSDRGVLDEFADDSLRTLSVVLGDLEVAAAAHDGHGGPEAEAQLQLTGGNARGTLVLSRLRTFRDRLEIAGSAGRISLDRRSGKLVAEPPGLLQDIENRPASGLSSDHFTWGSDYREGAEVLRHPWELADGRRMDGLAGRRVLVTGASGFIGARVVERLAENAVEVTALVRNRAKAARITRLGVELVMEPGVDLTRLIEGHDAVVNLAHDLHAPGPRNEGVSLGIADACEAAGVQLLVQASSIAVYDGWPGAALDEASPSDGPGHGYKLLKRAIERDLAARQAAGRLRSVVLQPTIVYGAFSKLWTDRFAVNFGIGDVAVPEDGLCEGVHVDDVADAILAAIARPEAAGRFIVSGPQPFAWRAMLAAYPGVCRQWGALRMEPAAPVSARPAVYRAPGMLATIKARAVGLAAGFTRSRLGEARLARLRAAVLKAAARGKRPLFRPAAENPRLFANRAAVSTERLREGLVAPRIGIEQGAELVRAYLKWRYCPFEDWLD